MILALLIFVTSLAIKSLHAVDFAPLMYTNQQPGLGMTNEYDSRAASIAGGHGCLMPDNLKPSDTDFLAYPPGYSIFLAAIYSVLGRSYFKVQLVQNLINSLSPVLIFLITGELVAWSVGSTAGFLAAVSHHLSYYSNFILPDALCALPVLAAVYLLLKAIQGSPGSYWLAALAGIMLGLSVWLRPNSMLMGPFLVVTVGASSAQRWGAVKLTTVTALISFLTVAPITVRNYLIYHEFVPVTNHLGVVLLEGIGEASGTRFGAVATDDEVAEQEAVLYGDQRYGGSWAAPDGIKRDRDRTKRSMDIILHHPIWYAGVMIDRCRDMLKYSAHAPLVFTISQANSRQRTTPIERQWRDIDQDWSSLVVGEKIFWMRPVVRGFQRVAKEAMLGFIIIGGMIMFVASWRRALLVSIVPLYYFLFQSAMHTEFRYTLPMQYFVFVFAAIVWVLIGSSISTGLKGVAKKLRDARPRALTSDV